MRRVFLFCAVVLLAAPTAFAIRKPHDNEIEAIRKQIRKATLMDKEIGEAQNKLYKAIDDKDLPGKIKELKMALDRETNRQTAARTKAIHMTLAAYDLWEQSNAQPSVTPLTKGRRISWIPVAKEREARDVQDKDGGLTRLKQPDPNARGITYPDGVTYLVPEAFQRGPGWLASILLHERIHFEQNTTPGKGDAWSEDRSQAEAYKAQVDNSKFFFDPVIDKTMIEYLEGQYATHQEAVDREDRELKTLKGKLKRLLAPSKPPSFLENRVHTQAELEALEKQAVELDKIVLAELDTVRRQRAETLDPHLRYARFVEAFDAAAEKYCADPGSVTQEELDALPKDKPAYCMSRLPSGRNSKNCGHNLFKALCEKALQGSPLEDAWVSAEANKSRIVERTELHRTLLLDFAGRSCANPGSVAQAELDQLKGFYDPFGTIHLSPLPLQMKENDCFNSLHDMMLDAAKRGNTPKAQEIEARAASYRTPITSPPQPFLWGGALADLAKQACSNPAGLTQQNVDRALMGLFPNEEILGADTAREGLSGCARELFGMILEVNGKAPKGAGLNAEWLKYHGQKLAEKYKPSPAENQPYPENQGKEKRGREDGPCGDGGSGCGRSRPTLPRH